MFLEAYYDYYTGIYLKSKTFLNSVKKLKEIGDKNCINFEESKRRGYIYQSNNMKYVENLINNKRRKYFRNRSYGSSIHFGHFFPITLVRRLQKMGHKPILVLGGENEALIGDPSGKR